MSLVWAHQAEVVSHKWAPFALHQYAALYMTMHLCHLAGSEQAPAQWLGHAGSRWGPQELPHLVDLGDLLVTMFQVLGLVRWLQEVVAWAEL